MKIRLREHISGIPTRILSMRVMYGLLILTVLVFGAFYLVEYDLPYDEDPSFNAPLFTDAVMGLIYLCFFVSAVLAVCSFVAGLRLRNKSEAVVNNIPVARTTAGIAVLTVLCMIVTFLLGSSEPMLINGSKYTDSFWLKASDMLINTTCVLLFVAVCGALFGLSGYNRKIKLRPRGGR